MNAYPSRLSLLLSLSLAASMALLTSITHGADAPRSGETPLIKMPKRLPECPATHITKGILASDGTVWVVSERGGVYKLGPESSYAGPWFHASYYADYPATDHFYGLAEDKQGRIWVGTDNQGVAVFNGVSWRTFNRGNALLGERVFDIAVSPETGEVAIATSGGVTIYDPERETWKDFNRADGLEQDQVQSLGFGPDGTLWLAYACGGVSRGSPKNGYAVWQTEKAPWYWDGKQRVRQPLTPRGNGLPSNLCNTLLASPSGTVWVGTVSGLACSDDGRKWKFVRGADYQDKNNGLFGGKSDVRVPSRYAREQSLLPEDFVTCLAETPDGLWVGTRRQGAALLGIKKLNVLHRAKGDDEFPLPVKWITSLIPFPDRTLYATTYGGGIVKLVDGKGKWERPAPREAQEQNIPHPAYPPVPDDNMLSEGVKRVERFNRASYDSPVFFWKEDWSTKGNWCGRYGANYAMLCAANAPWANEVYNFMDEYQVTGLMGAHRSKKDFLRNWVHWVDAPDNDNVLYCPTDATRCEAEWDDHGEGYAVTHDGPDIWALVNVPEGRQIVSLYFYNPNGLAEPTAACRDYLIEVRRHRPSIPEEQLAETAEKSRGNPLDGTHEQEMGEALGAKVLARTRVREFAGTGVYKSFVVNGPGVYYFRICKNYSFNTILNGVFIERGDKNHIDNKWANRGHLHFFGAGPARPQLDATPAAHVQSILDTRYLCRLNSPYAAACFHQYHVYQYRRALEDGNSGLCALLRWSLDEWTSGDRHEFISTMQNSWNRKQELSPAYRSALFMPNAPNVIPFSIDEVMAMERLKIDWKHYLPAYPDLPAIPVAELRPKLAAEITRFKHQQKQLRERLSAMAPPSSSPRKKH